VDIIDGLDFTPSSSNPKDSVSFVSDRFGNEGAALLLKAGSTLETNEVPSPFSNSNGDFTITAWLFNPSSSQNGKNEFFVCNHRTLQNNKIAISYSDIERTFLFSVSNQNGNSFNTGPTNRQFPLNKWTHIAITYRYSTRTIRFFVNADFDTSFEQAVYDPFNTLTLEKCALKQFATNSLILDELKIFNAQLTPSQLLDDMYYQHDANGQYKMIRESNIYIHEYLT
jgi:hypothetical protein